MTDYKKSVWKGRRVTDTKTFIDKATWTWLGDLFNYSKVDYKGSKEKVKVICRVHGEFLIKPSNHLSGKGCRKCRSDTTKRLLTSNNQEFIRKAMRVHQGKYTYDEVDYKLNSEKVSINCPDHGSFSMIAKNHLKGHGCPECALHKIKTTLSSNTEDFVRKARKVHGNRYTYKNVDYVAAIEKVLVTCKCHGNFAITPHNHLQGQGCSECYYEAKSWRLTPEQKNLRYFTYLVSISPINNPDRKFYKVGITGKSVEKRLSSLISDGFTYQILSEYEDTGVKCQELEDSVLEVIRAGNQFRRTKDLRGTITGGWTECFEECMLDKVKHVFDVIKGD